MGPDCKMQVLGKSKSKPPRIAKTMNSCNRQGEAYQKYKTNKLEIHDGAVLRYFFGLLQEGFRNNPDASGFHLF